MMAFSKILIFVLTAIAFVFAIIYSDWVVVAALAALSAVNQQPTRQAAGVVDWIGKILSDKIPSF